MALLLSILTFLSVVSILVLIWLFVGTDGSQDVVRRRMESVRKAERRGDVSLSLKLVGTKCSAASRTPSAVWSLGAGRRACEISSHKRE